MVKIMCGFESIDVFLNRRKYSGLRGHEYTVEVIRI